MQLAATRLFRVARRIALYLPNDGEIDPVPLMTRVWAMNKTYFLPVLSRLKHDRLWFAPFTPDTALVPNRFGIPEPLVAPRAWLRAPDLDLILMPLVFNLFTGTSVLEVLVAVSGAVGSAFARFASLLVNTLKLLSPPAPGRRRDLVRMGFSGLTTFTRILGPQGVALVLGLGFLLTILAIIGARRYLHQGELS